MERRERAGSPGEGKQAPALRPDTLEVVGVLPVAPGDTIPLPFDPQGLLARLDINGNLAIRSGDRTFILQNFIAADLRAGVTILADDDSEIDVPLVIAATGPDVAFPTAGGFVGTPVSNGVSGNGIFELFSDVDAAGPLGATGVLHDTDVPPAAVPIPLRSSPDPDLLPAEPGVVAPPTGNSNPIAFDVAVSAVEDGGPVDGAFDATDPDPADQGKLAFVILSQPPEGTVTNDGDGTFIFSPGSEFQDLSENETRDVTFTYQATDPHGAISNPATVTVTVAGKNDAPIAADLSAIVAEGAATGPIPFLGADPDDDPASLVYSIVQSPSLGAVTLNNDGTFSFDTGTDFDFLVEGQTLDVTFTYQATDPHGASSNQATVTVTVAGKNDAPIAADLSATVAEGAATGPIPFPGADPDDDPASLVYNIVQSPSLGAVTLNNDGSFSFDTGTDFDFLVEGQTLDVTFTYQATDPHGAISNQATVTMTVIGANVVPDSDECPIPPPSVLAGYDYAAGSGGADTIDRSGSDGNQWIQGFAGDDILTGAGLDDLIEGGEGNDTIDGGGGADILLAGAGADTISGGEGEDCVDAGAGNDTIDGGNSNDHLHGDDGDDVLLGGNAEDTLEGGAGNDQLFGGNDQDTVSGNDGDDTIDGGNGEDTLDGGAGNDNINGGSGDDTITGGGGNDIVEGGNGKDTIDGQPGDLIIRFSSILDAGDVIINFDANPDGGQDVIDLDPLFDSLEATLGPLNASSRSDLLQVTFNSGVAEIFIDDDKDSGTAAILLATVSTSDPLVVGSTLIIDTP